MTAMCLALFMGFAALAIDVGYFYRVRQRTQIAADAAATAAGQLRQRMDIPTASTASR